MKNKLSYGMRSRMATVVMPILLLLALMAFPVARAIRTVGEENPFDREITGNQDVVASTSSGTICWGLKRGENGAVPEVPSTYKVLMQQYGALYVGDTGKKTIYLTFDEGYENGYTAKILDTLNTYGVKGIFFITGDYFESRTGWKNDCRGTLCRQSLYESSISSRHFCETSPRRNSKSSPFG